MKSSAILRWVADIILLPLIVAAGMLLTRWGKDNLAYVLLVPTLFMVWRMFVHSFQRPAEPQFEKVSPLRNSLKNWHALHLLALFALLVFEAGVAAMAETRVKDVRSWALFFLCVFVPYVLLSLASTFYLLKARRLFARLSNQTVQRTASRRC